jgi:UDP-2-acetamido-3-amino-2,3-dideoxy-glucuronate N-acetyltransferase
VSAETGRERKMADYFVHESSFADEGCKIGAGTRIWHFCHVSKGAVIGEKCVFGQNIFVSATARIGDCCKIQNNVSIYDNVTLEDGVFCGPSMVFTNVFNPRAFIERKNEYRSTLLRKGCSVGANATIVCGVTLGEYCFIGAGSVVTKDVPAFGLVYGNPGRLRGWICRCGVKLSGEGETECGACGLKYRISGGACAPLLDMTLKI